MGKSLQQYYAELPEETRREYIAQLPDYIKNEMARGEWWWTARPEQVPPDTPWFICLALAGRGFGKMVSLDTLLPTPHPDLGGFRKMADLKVGDWVFDETGKPCRITATFDAVPEVAYRLTFSDGVTVDACSEHQWVTWTHADRKAYLRSEYESDKTRFPAGWTDWRPLRRRGKQAPQRDEQGSGPCVRTTQDIVDTLTHGARKDTNHCIPVSGDLQLPDMKLPLDPWTLGYWLGNGATKNGTISGHLEDEQHVRTKLAENWQSAGANYARNRETQAFSFTAYGLIGSLRTAKVLENKHVPDMYLWASAEQRRALLAGLMDSDGYGEKSKVEFSSSLRVLADAVMHLARSLGQRPTLYVGRATLNGQDMGPKYRVNWRPTFNPFTSPRKMATYMPPDGQGLRTQHRMIVSAERIDSTPMRCITVDSPNSMYLITEAMIPTHNTRAGAEWMIERVIKHPYDAHGVPTEWLIIGETLGDARAICVEGPAGILRVLERRKIKHKYVKSPRSQIRFPNGAKIHTEGADDPDVGRGYNAAGAWLDELCIAEHELIATSTGDKPIELVRRGDLVLTRDGYRPVLRSGMTHPDAAVVQVVTADGRVTLTADHQVWTTEQGWVAAKDVVPGASMITCLANIRPSLVLAVNRDFGRAKVYDLEVEGSPEFFAGGLLVHNCKWRYSKESWDEGIMPSLRADLVDDQPRAFVTTTPKPIKILQQWLARTDGSVHLMRGSTFDNSANLSAAVLVELKNRYEGTLIGRQELYGEIIEAFEGALFSRLDLENYRVHEVPDELMTTIVGVDPSLTGEDDEMGVVVVANTPDRHMYVLADKSIMAVGRAAALHAWRVVAEYGADLLVYESNLGKRWMATVFEDAYQESIENGLFARGTRPPMKPVDAKIGKRTRGEPVAMRSEQGKLHMVGRHPALEDQCATFTAWGTAESPDRLDALVHACRWIMQHERKSATITSATDFSSTLQSLFAETARW